VPKRVDHDRRRGEIAQATWRLMAERGVDAVTMREISASLGVANGALKHYFPGKNAIIESAFRHVFEATNARVEQRVEGLTGLAALRVFCMEVLPLEELTVLEARVVIPFWQRALTDAGLADVFAVAMAQWRRRIGTYLEQGRAAGEVTSPVPDEVIVEQLLALLNGAQPLRTLTPTATGSPMQLRMLEAFLAGLSHGPVPAGSSTRRAASGGGAGSGSRASTGFLSFAEVALERTTAYLPETDREAMTLVLLLHRVASSLVYDLESTVHRPAGWSWSAFRLLFTLWVAGEQEAGRAATLSGMSRAAVSSLANTLAGAGLVERRTDARDRRSVRLGLTDVGRDRIAEVFRAHNRRESEWSGLLAPHDLARLNDLLVTLVRSAQQATWINRRS
jgi:AcrR family transcriptional regulator/DNA-binding MarR family transcriptional regulator